MPVLIKASMLRMVFISPGILSFLWWSFVLLQSCMYEEGFIISFLSCLISLSSFGFSQP